MEGTVLMTQHLPNRVGSFKKGGLICAAAIALLLLLAPSAFANAGIMNPGVTLYGGQSVRNSTNQFRFTMQRDGNLVLYQQASRAMWNSHTNGHSGAKAVMQYDGNLVVYSSGGNALWHSHTNGRSGSKVAVQDDGNVVIYAPGGGAIWQTGTVYSKLFPPDYLNSGHNMWSGNRNYHLVMQYDGNLVLYNQAKRQAIWASNTAGKGDQVRAVMQTDGNLVVYYNSCRPFSCWHASWNSHTSGQPGAYLNLQSDGNLVLYRRATAVWSSRTSGR